MEQALAVILLIWIEGENFKTAPEGLEMTIGAKAPASGGKALYGGALDKKGAVVTYEFDVPADMTDGQIIFRYARLHWRPTMKPAAIEMTLAGPGGEVKKELAFDDTKGWGEKAADYRLLAATLGAIKKGKHTLTLTSQAEDNSVTLDGFFVAPASFKITDEELNRCCRIAIGSSGYLGLARASLIVRQDIEKTISLVVRPYSEAGPVRTSITLQRADAPAQAKPLVPMDTSADIPLSPRILVRDQEDGAWVLKASGGTPQHPLQTQATLILCGQFLSALDARLKAVADYTSALEKAGTAEAATARALPDFQHIAAYLETNAKKLGSGGDANDESAFKKGLAALEGMRNPDALIGNMRRALEQAEAMMKNTKAGKDAYEGMAGDIRRAYRSAADNALVPYRVFVPDAYAKADKVPFVYMLHGGGGDEDYWPDMEEGKILKILNERGYLAVMPKWHSRNRPAGDVKQLLDLSLKEYPKIDADRVYCTGISMGGFGTYNLVTEFPECFAAACCVSGTGDVAKADKLKNVPLLIFQGGADTVVPPAGAERVAAKMKELGYTVDLRIFPKYGHNYHAEEYLNLTLDFFGKYTRKK